MDEHSHPANGPHGHESAGPETPVDPGSQALVEALRSSFAVVKFVMAVLVVVFLGSGLFQVKSDERAIILRFGKPVGESEKALLGPGLHWSFPYPIDEYVKVSVTGIKEVTSTTGWYATTPEQELAGTEPPPGRSLNPAVDGYVITADNNIIHTRATLYYQVEDPIRYVFYFVNATNVVRDALNRALVSAAARFKVDDILTRDVAGFRDAVRSRAAEILDQQKVGVTVGDCVVQSIPPRQLKAAFENVVRAGVMRVRMLDDAHSYQNQVSSKASADAESRVNEAESERVRLVNDIASQAENFSKILPRYEAAPDLFVRQRLAETFGLALANAEKWVLPTAANGKSMEVRLLLNREPPKLKTESSTQP